MADLTKLAGFLNSFNKTDPNYDLACFIKSKIASDLQDPSSIHNGEEDDLQDNDVTMSTGEQRSSENQEGEHMDGAFKELDVLNKIKEDKEHVASPSSPEKPSADIGNASMFGDNAMNQKNASLYDLLRAKLKK